MVCCLPLCCNQCVPPRLGCMPAMNDQPRSLTTPLPAPARHTPHPIHLGPCACWLCPARRQVFFRYARYFPDGTFLYRTSPEIPAKAAKALAAPPRGQGNAGARAKRSGAEHVFHGQWRLLVGEDLRWLSMLLVRSSTYMFTVLYIQKDAKTAQLHCDQQWASGTGKWRTTRREECSTVVFASPPTSAVQHHALLDTVPSLPLGDRWPCTASVVCVSGAGMHSNSTIPPHKPRICPHCTYCM